MAEVMITWIVQLSIFMFVIGVTIMDNRMVPVMMKMRVIHYFFPFIMAAMVAYSMLFESMLIVAVMMRCARNLRVIIRA